MRGSNRLLQFGLWGVVVLLTARTAMAAEASPPVRLRIPFVTALTDDSTFDLAYGHGHCAISGEQALRIERDTSNPCLAADASPVGACFDRLGLSALRSRRALWPRGEGRHCME
jgi:hypothetical protein